MNKILKIMMVGVFIFIASFYITGCSLKEKIDEYSSNKVEGYLNIENVTQFSYDGYNYTILEDTVSNGDIGEWIGYIRKIAAVDDDGKIVLQDDIDSATFKTLKDLKDKAIDASYIISFSNVYATKNHDTYLIVEVNGGYHKAILNENVKDNDNIFDFGKNVQSTSSKFTINPKNATQLLCDGKVYQVTSDTVSKDELGSYIDIIAERVIFDAETKVPLSKEKLNEIDWFGTNSDADRKEWFYNDVYEIFGTKQTEKVAVNVNDQYYVAKQIG